MSNRKIGRFKVSEKLLREAVKTGHGANLFADWIPLDINRNWETGTTEYLVWHPSFEPVKEGDVAPWYVATFEAGQTKPTWHQIGLETPCP